MSPILISAAIFRDIAPSSSHGNWLFGRTFHLHLQGRKLAEKQAAFVEREF
jgi:hypothetical protein